MQLATYRPTLQLATRPARDGDSPFRPEPASGLSLDWRTWLAIARAATRPGERPAILPPDLVGRLSTAPPEILSVPWRRAALTPGRRAALPPQGPRAAKAPQIARWQPGEPLPSVAAYQAALAYALTPQKQALLARLATEPVFRYIVRAWQPVRAGQAWWGDEQARRQNLILLNALYDRVSLLVATCFDFEPAPLVYVPIEDEDTRGMYFPEPLGGIPCIALRGTILDGPVSYAVEAIAHEQIHAFQFDRIHRTQAGEVFDPWLQSLVQRWADEHPRMAEIPYRDLSVEIHAWDVGLAARATIEALERPENPWARKR